MSIVVGTPDTRMNMTVPNVKITTNNVSLCVTVFSERSHTHDTMS